jgi:subtilisin-like proprotein convertase family protein
MLSLNLTQFSRKVTFIIAIGLIALAVAGGRIIGSKVRAAFAADNVVVAGTGTGNIPDPGILDITFPVTGRTGTVTDVVVEFTGTHTYLGDLTATLIAPDDTQHLLFARPNSTDNSADLNGTYIFADSASGTLSSATGDPRPSGLYRTASTSIGPATSLLTSFGGKAPNGNWVLRFNDNFGSDSGNVSAARLYLVTEPLSAPTVTASTTPRLFTSSSTLLITGTNFIATPASSNTVTFNNGAVGTVTSASGLGLIVTISTPPATAGALTAVVTTPNGNSGAPVQVANIVPVITANTAAISPTQTSLTINGFGFDPTPGNNVVQFSPAGTGTVTAATTNALEVTGLTGLVGANPLRATVTVNGVASSPANVQVATILPANDTANAAVPLFLNLPVLGGTVGAVNDYQIAGTAGQFPGVGNTASTAVGGDVVYRFTAPVAGVYSFRVTRWNDSAGDLLLYLASELPSGAAPQTVTSVVAAANRNNDTAEEVLGQTMAAGQTYFVVVDQNVTSNGSAFEIEVNDSVLETEPNDTVATALPFVNGIAGVLISTDTDFFSIGTPPAGSRVFALDETASSGTSNDTVMRITTATDTLEYDETDGDIFSSGSGHLASSSIAGTILTGVPSYVRMNTYDIAPVGVYRLHVVVQPPSASATAEAEPNGTTAQANSGANNYFAGALSAATDQDLFRFTATAGQLVMFNLDCNPTRDTSTFDGRLELLDSTGATIVNVDGDSPYFPGNANGFNATSGAGNLLSETPQSPSDGFVYRIRTAGTYYIRVSAVSFTFGDYLLSISKAGAGIVVPPTVTVPTSTNLAANSATLGGNVASDGGAAITERGVVYALTALNADPQIGGANVVKATTTGTTGLFTVDVGGLLPSTAYSFKAYATNSQGTTYSAPVATFTTPAGVVSLASLALSSGTLAPTFGSAITSYTASVAVASLTVTATPDFATTAMQARVNSGAFVMLTPGNASAALPLSIGNNSVEVKVTAQDSVTTKTYLVTVNRLSNTPPTVTTAAQGSVSSSTAVLGGEVTSDGGASVSERGIVWATATNPTISNNKVVVGSGTGAFSATVAGLPPSTTIYVRAYATNGAGTSYGAEINFATPAVTPGSIAWSAPVTFTGDVAQVLNNGFPQTAIGFASTPLTINGVTFARLISDGTIAQGAQVSLPSIFANSGSLGIPGGATDYRRLLAHANFHQTANGAITISGLTAGIRYQVQLFMPFWDNAWPTAFGSTGGGAAILETGYGTAHPNPDIITGTFTATAATQVISYEPVNGWAGLAALSLRRLDPPTPLLLPSGAVSWYRAEGNALDAVSANHGTANNVSYVAGRTGQAMSLTGASGSFVNCTNNASLQLNTGTVEAWIKTSDAGASYRGILVKQDAFGMYLNDGVFQAFEFGGAGDLSTGVNLADNAWHHVAMSFDSGVSNGWSLYVDGVRRLTTTATTTNQTHALVLGAGNAAGDMQNFNGLIDEAAIYNRVLSEAEIQAIYNAGTAGKISLPTVTTAAQTSVTATSATLGGNVTADGGTAITERGVVYALTATNNNPEIGGTGVSKIAVTGTTGVFTANVTGLSPNAGYSFKAYATNSVGTSYTSPVSPFTTLATPNTAPSFALPVGPAGAVWTPRETDRLWQSITSSADGSKLAAVVRDGQIYTSTDSGATWTPRETDRLWQSITSSADGSKLAAVVRDGQIYTSTDSGATWTPQAASGTRRWVSISSSADGSKLAAVVEATTINNGAGMPIGQTLDRIYTSTDSGVTWTPRDANRKWSSITSSADGSKLAAVVEDGQIYTSTNSGVTWTPRDANRVWWSITSSADGSKLAAVVLGGQIYTSTDSGVTWTPRDANRVWWSITSSADGSKLAAVADQGQIYTSTDSGVTWTPRDANRRWSSITSSADGSKLAAVVSDGQIYTSVGAIVGVSVAAGSGAYAQPFATSISPGPAAESAQTVSFTVTGNTNPGLFTTQPAISSTGTLTFTPASPATTAGTATISVQLVDNGGTDNGGVNTSPVQTFTIKVIPVITGTAITPLAVTTTSQWVGPTDGVKERMIDGSGLSGSGSVLTQTHDALSSAASMWHAGPDAGGIDPAVPAALGNPPAVNTQAIEFDLGANYDLTGAHIWNFNGAGVVGRGVKDVQILVSSSTSGPFTPLTTTLFDRGTDAPGLEAQIVPLTGATNVRRVRFAIQSAWSGQANEYVGLSEVRFQGTLVLVAPTVTTATQSGVTATSAVLGGNVTADGGASVTERGIVWATTTNPTTANNKVAHGTTGTGTFSATVINLPAGTTIYVRAYAINSAGTSYGNEISFMTQAGTWAARQWVNDATAGITANTVWARRFGSADAATVNGVNLAGIASANAYTSTEFDLAVPNFFNNDSNTLTPGGDGSASIAQHFAWGGNPATLTVKGLTVGQTYTLTFLSVGWDQDTGARNITFTSGADSLTVNQNQYGADNGIRIEYNFVANAATHSFTMAQNDGLSFHLYGLALATGNPVVNMADYSVTTTGNVIAVTDNKGNGDTLAVSEPAAGSIRFAAPGRSFSVNGGALSAGNSGDLALSGITGITVNAAGGNDTLNVEAFSGTTFPSLTLNGGTGDDTINLNGDITFAADANLDLDLQNDDAAPGTDVLNVAANANLLASGTGTITARVSKNAVFNTGSSFEAVNGGIVLAANQQTTATTGSFIGVNLAGSILSTGTGNVTVQGRGGDAAINYGTFVNGGVISGGLAGTSVTVQGTGGTGAVSNQRGVTIGGATARITSSGGNVIVTGQGGGGGGGTFSYGVDVRVSSMITAGGSGTVTVTGTGGNGTGASHLGVHVLSAGTITSSGGNVTVTGTSGQIGAGVAANGGTITAGGGGTVTILGTGTGAGGHGVFLTNVANSVITSGGGAVSITGIAADAAASDLLAGTGALLGVGGSGTLTINANSVSLDTSAALVNAGSNTIFLRPRTAGTLINLGGADAVGSPSTLGLTDAELDRITCGTLTIGSATSGAITVSANVTRAAATNLALVSAGDVVLNATLSTGGGTLLLDPGANPAAVKPLFTGTDVTASALSFASELALRINGATAGTQYDQLNVAGGINLTGVALLLSGSHTPTAADSFTIVENDGTDAITGTFTGLAEGATVSVNGVNKKITYVGGTGNDVVLYALPTVTTATQSGVTATSAVLGGEVTADGGTSVTERGIVWATTTNPTTANNKVAHGTTGTGPFSATVTGLPALTTVYARAYATNGAGTAYGDQISFTTLEPPAGTIAWATPTTYNGDVAQVLNNGFPHTAIGFAGAPLTINGVSFTSLTSNGTVAQGAQVSVTSLFSDARPDVPSGATDYRRLLSYSNFHQLANGSITVSGLVTGIRYQVQLFMPFRDNSWPTTFGSANGTTVTLDTGFGSHPNPDIVTGTFTASGATQVISYSPTRPFASLSAVAVRRLDPIAPAVAMPTVASITANSAILGGNVTDDGGATVTERGVVYALTSANSDPVINGASVTKVVASGTTGVFTASITDLTPGSGYSFKAYATNSAGTSYTNVTTFTITVGCAANVSSGAWTTVGTWGCSRVPLSTDDVVIQSGQNVTLDTTTPQFASLTVEAGATLTVSANVTLPKSVTINGTLVLNGDLNTGVNTLTLGSTASCGGGSGDVIGSVRRTGLTTETPYCFGNAQNQLNFANQGTPPTEVLVSLTKTLPGTLSNAVTRLYSIQATGGSGYSATVRLRYLDGELNGQLESQLKLWRYNGTSWENKGGTVEPSGNYVETTGVTAFSPWALAGPNAPTAVTLADLSATSYDTGTLIEWQTGSEASNLGFHVYREEQGQRVALTPELLAGSALRAGNETILTAGHDYAWWDQGTAGAAYWIEDWDLDGTRTWHGPVYARLRGGPAPAYNQAALLSRTGVTAGATRVVEPAATSLSQPAGLALAARRVTTEGKYLSSLAGQAAVKISLSQTGWQRVTFAQLQAAGLPPDADPYNLQLYANGQAIPLLLTGVTKNRLEPEAAVEFYGVGVDTPSTDTRVYWLVEQHGNAPARVELSAARNGSRPALGYARTVERRDRTIYFSSLLNGPEENFFGALIGAAPLTQNLETPRLTQHAAPTAVCDVWLQGLGAGTHRVTVSLNDQTLGVITFTDRQRGQQSFTVPHALLRESNTLTLQTSGSSDVCLVDKLRLTYQRLPQADNDMLSLTARPGAEVTATGFTSSAVRVFDVTDEYAVTELPARITNSPAGNNVTVSSAGPGERRLLFVGAGRAHSPANVRANRLSTWLTPDNAADLVILTHGSLLDSFQALADYRRHQGWRVAVIDVEDVYDELRFGHKDPTALTELLSYAVRNWQVKPRFVLLGGKATYDPRNYSGAGEFDLTPTRLADIGTVETASDEALLDFDGDGAADLAVGRLPARNAAEARQMVERVISYERNPSAPTAVLVADHNDGFNFVQSSDALRPLFPPDVQFTRLYRNQLGDAETRRQLLAAFADGAALINYQGHGSFRLWRGNVLTAADVTQLRNPQLPVLIAMTCLNGYVVEAASDSLSELLLKAPEGGAVAVVASSAYTGAGGQAALNALVFQHLLSGQPLGEALRLAKQGIADAEVRRSCLLLGDPLLRLPFVRAAGKAGARGTPDR